MTTETLSPIVARYFTLSDGPDRAQVVDVFTDDATVLDDGHTYRGREAILAWLTGPASEFTTTSTRLSLEQTDGVTVVVTLLEGNFPGGRVELRYEFHETDGRIGSLSITA
ncbi:MAG: nuclear transport factor 2 family protein [Rhodococcus sp. (in: high G+C Gram-positive bacteria)]